jgi:hypothetical protein
MDYVFSLGVCLGIVCGSASTIAAIALHIGVRGLQARRAHKKNVAQLRDALIKAIAKEAAEKAGKHEADS